MRNHDEKRRDMCRSILPSTARRSARQNKALLKRSHRSHIRQVLRKWSTFDDPWEFEGFAHEDTNRPICGGVSWMDTMQDVVDDRRQRDNVGALVNWVKAIRDDLPGEDDEAKFEALRAMLPKNLIGRHALSHVDYLFDLPAKRYYYRHRRRYEWDEEIEAQRFLDFVTAVRQLVIIEHRYVNEVFRGRETCRGLHDVDRFATAIARDRELLPVMRRVLAGERVKTGTFALYDLRS